MEKIPAIRRDSQAECKHGALARNEDSSNINIIVFQ
jgi:hypothetical protein